MKYDKKIERIKNTKMTRSELARLKVNAENIYKKGDLDAKYVIDVIDAITPTDTHILFMGFCPDANIHNRLDLEWKSKGICEFDFFKSQIQMEQFYSICKGDLVILKKREKLGETMKLYGHGRVTDIAYDEHNVRYLKMQWSSQEEIIEVPLMGCNSTVNIREIDVVEAQMPEEFYSWLSK
ncbi:hypothetical protein QJU43_08255 [Pasteurella atlantica]|uniref:hypothetical protein n=1 Tax=Pasteurellaceae TaxID=712 RepID=UPI0027686638|nr:hypothetical protein [Pasteurella atlantica]MDP8034192.1 hypothetical protein [Pasteurella atlantica]MDP8036145.1 hypothetical protein [Pasteurella atlantica]MDP8038095.1 hypothetical protein [Pasteurella atlantica]MDP8048450.1 hypothetical protein [Pasteurella atlantica]MDP8050407.1 hypothetical protein [Pasteurella atlantica]